MVKYMTNQGKLYQIMVCGMHPAHRKAAQLGCMKKGTFSSLKDALEWCVSNYLSREQFTSFDQFDKFSPVAVLILAFGTACQFKQHRIV